MDYSKSFSEEMKEILCLPKHVISAMEDASADSYQQRSLELINLLYEALADFQKTRKKVFGVYLKDSEAVKIKYFREGHGNNIRKWKELESKRRRAKKAYIIAYLALKGKDINNIHPQDFLDDDDKTIREIVKEIEEIARMKTHLFMWDDNNYFIKPL